MAIKKAKRHLPLRDKDLDSFKLEDVTIKYEYTPGYFGGDMQSGITIYGDGKYELLAIERPTVENYVNPKLVFYVIERLCAANFVNLKDEYSGREWFEWDENSGVVKRGEACSTDLSDSTITLAIGNRCKTVYNYEGAPEELDGLSDMFQNIIGSLRTHYMKKPRRCPICGGRAILDIIYGEPSYETFQRAEKGEFVLRGCCVDDNSPRWMCRSCGADFRREL